MSADATQFDLRRFRAPQELADAAAHAWLDELAGADPARDYSVALSGGRITQAFFLAVVKFATQSVVKFDRVHFYWADERCVPPADAESNYRIAHELLFAPLHVSGHCVHRIRGEEEPQFAAAQAEAEICRHVPLDQRGQPVLDLIFLGMGEDGHVASLFPREASELRESRAVYRSVIGPKPPPNRVTLGYAAIVAARKVWMLASGAGKEIALRESLSATGTTPFGRVIQLRSRTNIFTDIVF